MDAYLEKLQHPLWQKKKGEILQRDGYKCRSCGREDITLHAHHLFYIPGTEPWDYKDDALVTYCEICHNTEHLIGNQLRDCLIELIDGKPLMIKMVAQLCVLSEKLDDFEASLRKFLNGQMSKYHSKRKNGNG